MNRGSRIAVIAVTLLTMALVLLAGLSGAPDRNWDKWGRHEKQYEELTDALLSGQLALKETPGAFLAETDNPYDPVERSVAAAEADSYALIDTAYYNGKYYTYFGVTPALLLYLPFRIVTGRMLPTWAAVIFLGVLTVPACFFFVFSLRKRYYAESNGAVGILLGILLVGAVGLPYLTAFCTTYSMPAVMGLFLSLTGLGIFLRAERPDGTLRRPCLLAGSVLLALTIGCRPVFAASYLLLFPIFLGAIRRGAFFRREKASLTNTVIVLVPALLLGSGFLTYNCLRFGNPLEFGFRYLFTTSDLLHSRLSVGASVESARLLLLQTPDLSTHFPFMVIFDYFGQYASELYVEPLFGGLLPLHPFLAAGLLLLIPTMLFSCVVKKKKETPAAGSPEQTKKAAPWGLALLSLIVAGVILATDASIAGVSQRYESDFALFVFLPAAVAFLTLYEVLSDRRLCRILLIVFLLLLTCAEVFLTFASICCDGRYFAMRDWNPSAYNFLRNIIFGFLP